MKINDLILLILCIILIGGAFWMTYRNSPKHGYILLGIVALSFVIGQIKGLQMYSLLGILGVLGIMVMSRNVREKNIQNWLIEKGFIYQKNENGTAKFNDNSLNGNNRFYCYKNKIIVNNQEVTFDFTIRMNTAQVGGKSQMVIHCSFYFPENINVNLIEQKLLKAKESTPKSNFFNSQFGYFDMKDCEIFRPKTGGIAIAWRTPDTVEGYNERYEWIKML